MAKTETSKATASHSSRFLWLALIWLVGFAIWFQTVDMPNNPSFKRWMLWERLPFDMLDLIDPPFTAGSLPWSWSFLLQRVPFLLIAVFIWFGACAAGSLILRLLRLHFRGSERFFFSMTLGLSGISLLMLGLGLCGLMSRWPLIAVISTCVITEMVCQRMPLVPSSKAPTVERRSSGWPRLSRFGWLVVIGLSPFVLGFLIGSMTPQNDFDVVEYHIEGPKEWFQLGQIKRLPHNVYTSFPFLTEMLVLSGMVLIGDWQWGALAGQAVIGGFAPLTAIGLLSAGKRWFSEPVGWIAALVYLTSPWTYRFTIIAYAEGGLSCYLFTALYAVLVFRDQCVAESPSQTRDLSAHAVLTGCMAGSAMACKYTGLVLVVLPIGLILIWNVISRVKTDRFQKIALVGLLFAAGLVASVGPWLLKNAVETGNPVYPLAVRVFGGIDRDEALDAQWRHAHKATTFVSWAARFDNLLTRLKDIAAQNDWHSPLMFGLAPLSLLVCLRRRKDHVPVTSESFLQKSTILTGWFYVCWQFLTWWLFTHQIDRFYVPMYSGVALLAGVGACWCLLMPDSLMDKPSTLLWKVSCALVVVASMLYSANLMQHSGISGFNAGRLDLIAARDIATPPRIKWWNDEFESGRLPERMKVLHVGEVRVFHARYPYLYNTVFDQSIFEKLCADPNSTDHQLRPASEIRAEFRRLGITHIDVCWEWILTYRQPGNYGYTEFVAPQRFTELQKIGILGPAMSLPRETFCTVPLTEKIKAELERLEWSPDLIVNIAGEPIVYMAQVFPVIDAN